MGDAVEFIEDVFALVRCTRAKEQNVSPNFMDGSLCKVGLGEKKAVLPIARKG